MGSKLYVGGLSYSTSSQQLREHFSACGQVTSADVISDRETDRSRGFGFVEFSTEAEAQAAIKQFDGQQLDGRTLKVNVAKDRNERSGGGGRSW